MREGLADLRERLLAERLADEGRSRSRVRLQGQTFEHHAAIHGCTVGELVERENTAKALARLRSTVATLRE